MKIIVEYAKSNRSTCKNCAEIISANVIRMGSMTRDKRGFDMTKWYHLQCFPLSLNSCDAVEAIQGFSALKQSDQESVRLTARDGNSVGEDAAHEISSEERHKRRKLAGLNEEHGLEFSVAISDKIENDYKGAVLLPAWKSFQTLIFRERDAGLRDSKKIAAFDFDGCLAKTSVRRIGAAAWSLMYPSIPGKLKGLYEDGYKLVIFTNESRIDKWKDKRQVAVDSKIGRLDAFIHLVNLPIQVFIACGVPRMADGRDDPFRKPNSGMWSIMSQRFNSSLTVDMDQSFYVGDAAGRPEDHSDADVEFARAVGLRFHVPEDYFEV